MIGLTVTVACDSFEFGFQIIIDDQLIKSLTRVDEPSDQEDDMAMELEAGPSAEQAITYLELTLPGWSGNLNVTTCSLHVTWPHGNILSRQKT